MKEFHNCTTHQFCYQKNDKSYHHLLHMNVFIEDKDVFIIFLRIVLEHYEEDGQLVINHFDWPKLPYLNYCN